MHRGDPQSVRSFWRNILISTALTVILGLTGIGFAKGRPGGGNGGGEDTVPPDPVVLEVGAPPPFITTHGRLQRSARLPSTGKIQETMDLRVL